VWTAVIPFVVVVVCVCVCVCVCFQLIQLLNDFHQTIDSIINNLCLINGPCKIALSLATDPEAVSQQVRDKLSPYLIAEFYNEGNEPKKPWYIFEYHQTLKVGQCCGLFYVCFCVFNVFQVLERVDLTPFDYIMRIRADNYISVPVFVMAAIGAGKHFDALWVQYRSLLRTDDMATMLRGWFMTGATARYIPKMIDQEPPHMAVSPVNSFEFNTKLLNYIDAYCKANRNLDIRDVRAMRNVVRHIALKQRVIYIAGGLFLHFGPKDAMVEITRAAFFNYRDQSLNWKLQMGHLPKAASHPEPIVQEANIRLTHRYLGYAAIDMHNVADYLVSFTYKYYGYAQLTRARGLVIWLLRERQVLFKRKTNFCILFFCTQTFFSCRCTKENF
jgi:hypothetical protein